MTAELRRSRIAALAVAVVGLVVIWGVAAQGYAVVVTVPFVLVEFVLATRGWVLWRRHRMQRRQVAALQ